MIVYNHNPKDSKPIIIISSWHPDPFGGPAIHDTTYMIAPGGGIDLDILGFKPEKITGNVPGKEEK
jgi:hypothetical protein